MTIKIRTALIEAPAIQWDGTQETWKAIMNLPRNNCWMSEDIPGHASYWGFPVTAQIGDWFISLDGSIRVCSSEDVRLD